MVAVESGAPVQASSRYFPPIDPELIALSARIEKVTMLEDRAQVRRRGRIRLVPGLNRLVIENVAPVLQDVSLQGLVLSGAGTIVDVRVRRAMRILGEHVPEAARLIEAEIEKLAQRFDVLAEDRARADERRRHVQTMLERAAAEVPEDAAWGAQQQQLWREAFESLFARARKLEDDALHAYFEQVDLQEEIMNASKRRAAIDRPDTRYVAWIEADVAAESEGEVELAFDYVVPNALWRPVHSAKLSRDQKLTFRTSAAVWQNTGEDWNEVELVLSTARSSLGTEPPLLSDDVLHAQKKAEHVMVEAREVAIQRASVGGPAGAPAVAVPSVPASVDLPGVDDGGDIQTLRARGACRIPSDGRPNMVPISETESIAETTIVVMPELEEKAFLRCVAVNAGTSPILAGPVELIRESGFVGWTKTLFVAPKEKFELSFGPEDSIRVSRKQQQSTDPRSVDAWKVSVMLVTVYLSNLSDEPQRLSLKERIPVSEVEQVVVALLADKTSGAPEVDDDGIVVWKVELPARDHKKIKLTWSLSVAPGVHGL
jgi:uncharacterized protein (TIGR02231 family)